MNLHGRAIAYNASLYGRKWPDSHLWVSATGSWLYGHWAVGSLFVNPTRYPGSYPRTVLERLQAVFPDVRERRTLHLFAGSVPKGLHTRVDINPDTTPDVVGNAYDLPELLRGRGPFDLVIADPPYTGPDARKRYGTTPIDKARVFRAMAATREIVGHVAWLDTQVPMYRRDQWSRWGDIAVERSTNQVRRGWALFSKVAA